MQPAPAVSLSCDDGGRWRLSQAALAGFTVAVLVRWALALGAFGAVPAWVAWALALVAGVIAAWAVWRHAAAPPARLAWDGEGWHLDVGGGVLDGQVRVAIDLGGWMLLCFSPRRGRGRRWLAVGATAVAPARPALVAGVGGSGAAPRGPAA